MSAGIDPSLVKQFRCFDELADQEAAAVAALLEPVHFAAGEAVFRQGDPGEALYLVRRGEIEIRLSTPGQHDYVCAALEPGTVFGEISPLLDQPRSAAAVARTRAELWRMPRAAFEAALARGDGWAVKFLVFVVRTLARRLVSLNQEVVAMLAAARRSEQSPEGEGLAEMSQLCNRMFEDELLGIVGRSLA